MGKAGTTASIAARAGGPYVGLSYYTEADAEWFFSRDEESQTIVGNLRAARLTILYARSGVGKSSLLRAGVARQLNELSEQLTLRGSAGYLPVVFSAWKDDPVEDLIDAIERAVGFVLAPDETPRLPHRLRDALAAAAAATHAEPLIILDQFEEYLLYHAQEHIEHSFVDELAACVNAGDLPANFLIAIREDAYPNLGDLFAGKVPNVYSNYLQLEPLDCRAGRTAIVRPLERCNELASVGETIAIEPELVDAVLTGVRVEDQDGVDPLGSVARHGGNGARQPRDEIEAPYLQLVMSALWEHERAHGSNVLRLTTLQELGGAREIIRTHLDGELDALSPEDYDTALALFGYLVTPSGSKIVYAASDLAQSVERSYDRVAALLAYLAREDKRIVRHVPPPAGKSKPADRYEIFHDVLGRPIVDWRRRALEQRKLTEQARQRQRLEREKREAEERTAAEERRRRAFQRLAAASLALLVIAVALGIWALISQQSAVSNLKAAQASQIVAGSERALPQDPELSMQLALRALHLKYSEQAEAALREALPRVQELKFVQLGPPLNSAAFSPDGREILTADEAGAATIFDLASRRKTPLDGHDGPLNAAAFSRDGTKVVTASKGGAVIIWDTVTGKRMRALPRRPEEVDDAAFSPDGTKVITANQGGTAIIWDAASGQKITTLALPSHAAAAFDSAVFNGDGTKVLTASESGTANVWAAATGQLLVVLHGHVGSVESAGFSPDGTKIVTAGEDGTARIWDASSGRQLLVLSALEGAVLSAEFSPDGREVVTANQDRTARIWDVATGKELMVLNGDGGPVRGAAFSPDGRAVVTAGEDGTARIWDASPRERITALRGGQGQVLDAAFNQSDTRVITANQNDTATIWDLANGTQLQLSGHNGPVYTAVFNSDGALALTASRDGTARIWSAENGKQLTVLHSDSGYLKGAAFNRSGNELVTASKGGEVRIWSTGGEPQTVLRPNAGSVESAVFSPSGAKVASANENGTATIWDLARPGQPTRLRVSNVPVLSVAFNPAETELATAGKDGIARIWPLGSGKPPLTLSSRGGPIFSATFSPDGRELVTADEDGEIRVWDAKRGRQLTLLGAHEGVVFSGAFNASGSEVVAATSAGDASIWSTELAVSRADLEHIAGRRISRQLTAPERESYLPH